MKSLRFSSLLLFSLIGAAVACHAQEADSVFFETEEGAEFFREISTLDPNKAAVLSAILPGLGQMYNGQYWKVPIIYGTFTILIHAIRFKHRQVNDLTNALRAQRDDDPNTINRLGGNISVRALTRNRDKIIRDRDFFIILTAAAYLVNVIEAHVAAHLHEFQINDKLSMNMKPKWETGPLFSQSLGLSLTLNF